MKFKIYLQVLIYFYFESSLKNSKIPLFSSLMIYVFDIATFEIYILCAI